MPLQREADIEKGDIGDALSLHLPGIPVEDTNSGGLAREMDKVEPDGNAENTHVAFEHGVYEPGDDGRIVPQLLDETHDAGARLGTFCLDGF